MCPLLRVMQFSRKYILNGWPSSMVKPQELVVTENWENHIFTSRKRRAAFALKAS